MCFPVNFAEPLINAFSTEHFWATASVVSWESLYFFIQLELWLVSCWV